MKTDSVWQQLISQIFTWDKLCLFKNILSCICWSSRGVTYISLGVPDPQGWTEPSNDGPNSLIMVSKEVKTEEKSEFIRILMVLVSTLRTFNLWAPPPPIDWKKLHLCDLG